MEIIILYQCVIVAAVDVSVASTIAAITAIIVVVVVVVVKAAIWSSVVAR